MSCAKSAVPLGGPYIPLVSRTASASAFSMGVPIMDDTVSRFAWFSTNSILVPFVLPAYSWAASSLTSTTCQLGLSPRTRKPVAFTLPESMSRLKTAARVPLPV